MLLGCCVRSVDDIALVAAAGLAYYELPVARLVMEAEDVTTLERQVQAFAIRPLAYNVLFPADLPLLDEAAASQVQRYVAEAFRRLARLGGRVVVFGSGQARSIPPSMSIERANERLAGIVRMLAQHAREAGLQLALEPLRRAESNVWNTISEAVAFLTAYDLHDVGVVADFYHMLAEHEPLSAIATYRERIVHAHLADSERKPPGFGTADVRGFLAALQSSGYSGLCSFECRWDDLATQLPISVRMVRALCEQG